MSRTLAWIVMTALVGALFWGVREHRRADALALSLSQTEDASAEGAERDRRRVRSGRGTRSVRPSPPWPLASSRPRSAPPQRPPATRRSRRASKKCRATIQGKLFDEFDKQKKSAAQRLDQLAQKLRLSGEQTQALQKDVDQMNERIGRALTALVAVFSQGENMQTRPAIDAMAEGFNAIRENEDASRASLDEKQQAELSANPLDFMKQGGHEPPLHVRARDRLQRPDRPRAAQGAVSVHAASFVGSQHDDERLAEGAGPARARYRRRARPAPNSQDRQVSAHDLRGGIDVLARGEAFDLIATRDRVVDLHRAVRHVVATLSGEAQRRLSRITVVA